MIDWLFATTLRVVLAILLLLGLASVIVWLWVPLPAAPQ